MPLPYSAPPPEKITADLDLSSALGGTRNPNLLIRSQMLCPIELRAPAAREQRTAVRLRPLSNDRVMVAERRRRLGRYG